MSANSSSFSIEKFLISQELGHPSQIHGSFATRAFRRICFDVRLALDQRRNVSSPIRDVFTQKTSLFVGEVICMRGFASNSLHSPCLDQ